MNRRSFAWLLIAILSAAGSVYLLGNDTVQLWDRDEPRYAQTSRQMLQSGDWVVPRFLDTVRTAKPVLIYWCQAAAMSVLGDNAFAARLPSVVAMVLTLAILAITITRESGSNRGLWTVFIFASSALAIGSAKMSLTDSVLLLFVTISQLCIYRIWKYGPGFVSVILLGLSVGLAGLTKGPPALGVNLTTIGALWLLNWSVRKKSFGPVVVGTAASTKPHRPEVRATESLTKHRRGAKEPRQWMTGKSLAIVIGTVAFITAMVVSPWIYLIEQRAPGFLTKSISHDVVDRMQSGHEGHSYPPGFYTLLVWVTFFPWGLLIPAALWHGWRNRRLPATRFALAALIGPWVMFELVAGKLPHYVLPTYPALAFLCADMLMRAARGAIRDLRSIPFLLLIWFGASVVVAIGCIPWTLLVVSRQFDSVLMIAASMTLVTAMLMGIGVAVRFTRGHPLAAARAMGLGMFSLVVVSYAMFLPRYEPLRISARVAQMLIDDGAYGQHGMMIDYKEPSLAFHQGGGLREQRDDDFLNNSSPLQWPRWVVLTRRVWERTRDDTRKQWDIIGSVRGVAYNEGGASEVLVLRQR